jgi:hypothetical protein
LFGGCSQTKITCYTVDSIEDIYQLKVSGGNGNNKAPGWRGSTNLLDPEDSITHSKVHTHSQASGLFENFKERAL